MNEEKRSESAALQQRRFIHNFTLAQVMMNEQVNK